MGRRQGNIKHAGTVEYTGQGGGGEKRKKRRNRGDREAEIRGWGHVRDTTIHGCRNIEQRRNREERMIIIGVEEREGKKYSRGVSRDMNETLRKEGREGGRRRRRLEVLASAEHNI